MSRPTSLISAAVRSSSASASACASSSFISASAVAGPSSLPLYGRPFSSTSSACASKRKLIAKRRKAANLSLQASRIIPFESIDPVLGRVHYRAPSSRSTAPPPPAPENPWEGCRLQSILLSYDSIAYSSPPNYAGGERPQFLLPGISKDDEDILFGALPHVAAELKFPHSGQSGSANGAGTGGQIEQDQTKQSEMVMRILDLRNAGKEAVNEINRKRVVDEFGNGVDTGSSSVQAALLTAKIHNLLSHITSNPKDTSNKRSLRLLVQQRARHLIYLRRTKGEEVYAELLRDLGLERGAVEGELKMSF